MTAESPENCDKLGVQLHAGQWTAAFHMPHLAFLETTIRYPYTERFMLATTAAALQLVPKWMDVVRAHVTANAVSVLAGSRRATLLVEVTADGTVCTAAGLSRQDLADLTAEVRGLGETSGGDVGVLSITLWRHGPNHRAVSSSRRLDAPSWEEIAANYPFRVRTQLDSLVDLDPALSTGRLLLFHGDPGTGKTTATLALMRTWGSWCDTHVVTDPERMFEDPDYLLEVLTDRGARGGVAVEGPPPPTRWKLVVAEDADEYLRSDARRRSGPALGRLLNATDGMLGRSLDTLVLLTTNDGVGRLHPAVTRPGRCLAAVEFARFSRAEAMRWLGGQWAVTAEEPTLAELFQMRDGRGGPMEVQPLSTGTYL